jgi:hypothetical protein
MPAERGMDVDQLPDLGADHLRRRRRAPARAVHELPDVTVVNGFCVPDPCAGPRPSLGCTVNRIRNQPCLGTDGDDVIIGGKGNDTLVGGLDSDQAGPFTRCELRPRARRIRASAARTHAALRIRQARLSFRVIHRIRA